MPILPNAADRRGERLEYERVWLQAGWTLSDLDIETAAFDAIERAGQGHALRLPARQRPRPDGDMAAEVFQQHADQAESGPRSAQRRADRNAVRSWPNRVIDAP